MTAPVDVARLREVIAITISAIPALLNRLEALERVAEAAQLALPWLKNRLPDDALDEGGRDDANALRDALAALDEVTP